MRVKAAVLREMGAQAPYASSRPLSVESVEIAAPGPGEVLVEMVAAGLCHSDLSVINGSRPRVMPMVLGHEASGVVRELGPDVRGLAVGDHVVFSYVPMCGHCGPCTAGRPVLCEPGAAANASGALLSGARRFRLADGSEAHHHLGVSAFSEVTVAAAESLVRIDPEFPLDIAALFGCAVMTGAGAVLNTAALSAGQSVAIFGMGGVGLSAVMAAAAAGAQSIVAVDLLADKLALASELGASHCVNAASDDPVEAIREMTQGGVDVAIEVVGSEKVLVQAYQACARGGTAVTVGLPHPDRMFSIPAVSLVAEEKAVRGCYMGSAVPARDMPRYMAMYRAGTLPVDRLLTASIGLDDVNAAFDALASGAEVRQVIRFH